MRTLGIAGTAKNTGKTTTTFALIEEMNKKKIKLGLTSIGYDGEEMDNITGLPKPRLKVKSGCFIATAERCLRVCTAEIQVLKKSDINTPLGKIVYGKVVNDGLVVIAGPNNSMDLNRALNQLKVYDCELVIVDGALNRLSPMGEADGLIVSTGAARNQNIDELVKETQTMLHILNLKQTNKKVECDNAHIYFEGQIKELSFNSLLNSSNLEEIISNLEKGEGSIFIPGLVSQYCFKELLKCDKIKGKTIICKTAINFLLGGDLYEVGLNLKKAENKGVKVMVTKKVPVLSLTINPFYPACRFNHKYSAEFVDKDELYQKMNSAVNVPVFNVMQTRHKEKLIDIVLSSLFQCK